MHEHRAMAITLLKDEKEEGESESEYGILALLINGIKFNELEDAPAREREPLARSTTSINMSGHKK